jgi:hypothetical protein
VNNGQLSGQKVQRTIGVAPTFVVAGMHRHLAQYGAKVALAFLLKSATRRVINKVAAEVTYSFLIARKATIEAEA